MNDSSKRAPLGVSARWLPFAVAAVVVVLDHITKIYIRGHFNDFDSLQVIPGLVRIVHAENPGAAFGMLANGSPLLRSLVLVGISGVVLFFVARALFQNAGSPTGALTRAGLALILGGAVGNLYDRIFLGTVTDFVEVYSGSWSFPAFNVADSAITIGAALLLIDLLRPQRKHLPQTTPPPAEF